MPSVQETEVKELRSPEKEILWLLAWIHRSTPSVTLGKGLQGLGVVLGRPQLEGLLEGLVQRGWVNRPSTTSFECPEDRGPLLLRQALREGRWLDLEKAAQGMYGFVFPQVVLEGRSFLARRRDVAWRLFCLWLVGGIPPGPLDEEVLLEVLDSPAPLKALLGDPPDPDLVARLQTVPQIRILSEALNAEEARQVPLDPALWRVFLGILADPGSPWSPLWEWVLRRGLMTDNQDGMLDWGAQGAPEIWKGCFLWTRDLLRGVLSPAAPWEALDKEMIRHAQAPSVLSPFLACLQVLALLGDPRTPPRRLRQLSKAFSKQPEGFEVATYRGLVDLMGTFQGAEEGFPWIRHLVVPPPHGANLWICLVLLVTSFWSDREGCRGLAEQCLPYLKILEEGPNRWLSRQIRGVLDEVIPGRSPSGEEGLLFRLVTPPARWRAQLHQMEEAARPGRGKGKAVGDGGKTKRLVWLVSWEPAEEGVIPSVRPVEQSLQARGGWSAGRPVALKRLVQQKVENLQEADLRASGAIRAQEYYNGWGTTTEYEVDGPRALEALAGHPLVFTEGDLLPLEVERAEPSLQVVRRSGRLQVVLRPFLRGNEERLVEELGPQRLRVVVAGPLHRNLAGILGPSGMEVPQEGEEDLGRVLGILAPRVQVHAKVKGFTGIALELVPGDPTPVLQLTPREGGLTADLRVRPGGAEGIALLPGTGAPLLFGVLRGDKGSRTVQIQRDLEREKALAAELLPRLPALGAAEFDGEGQWVLPTPEEALELLAQVDRHREEVRLEWPQGQPFRVLRSLETRDLSLVLQSRGGWLEVGGDVPVDGDRILALGELLERWPQHRGRFLPLEEGGFVALSQELRRTVEELVSLGERRGRKLRVPFCGSVHLQELVSQVGSLKADRAWEDRVARFREAAALDPPVPPSFRGDLRPYQVEGFQWMARLAHAGVGACLADDMGLGKTVQTLALLLLRAAEGPALVLVPASVESQWLAEMERFAPTLKGISLRSGGRGEGRSRRDQIREAGPFDVVVASYGLLLQEAEALRSRRWATLVLDEAQSIKNTGTKRSDAAMDLEGDFRLLLTGTPLENRLGELWNLFRFLNPGLLGSQERFLRQFAQPIERDRDKEAAARLRRRIRPFLLRRTKEKVLEELPSKTELVLRVDLSEDERAFYEGVRRSALERLQAVGPQGEGGGRFALFAELMRLRRACCDVRLVAPEAGIPSSKQEAFWDLLAELRQGGHRALVFSQFVDHLVLIAERLREEGVPFLYLDGGTPTTQRADLVARFQRGEGDCFLISLKAGGLGLNLTGADYVIHLDPWWNPAVEDQASDRAHRIGQARPVTVYRILARDTLEERIVELHRNKRELAEQLVGEGAESVRLSDEEVLALLLEED